jgi:hypothetical protein
MRDKIELLLQDYRNHLKESETLIEQCILATIVNDLEIALKVEADITPLYIQMGMDEVKIPDFLRKQAE